MVQIIKYVKYLIKVFLILVIIFGFTTFLNGSYIFRPRIRPFHIWKINYNPTNFDKGFRRNKTKYILIWAKEDDDFNCLKEKRTTFQENKCKHNNCYVTKDRNLLRNDIRNFDAILLNGRLIADNKNVTLKLPERRFLKQTYVFAMKESADNYPICNSLFDNYFNVTWTYRLDSDAKYPYFSIYDKERKEIGPKIDMNWVYKYDEDVNKEILANKKFIAAWFVSNCYTNNRRESFFNDIKLELLKTYKLHIDVVGACGSNECPKENDIECLEQLRKYYFYFAFENSFSNFYVTEKVLKALQHDTVPIVYGGADYSSFLPPNSYIDAKELGAEKTAAKIAYLTRNHTSYLEYFRWRNHYSFGPARSAVCNLCKVLNKKVHRIYGQFRYWWNPHFKKTCKARWRHIRPSKKLKNITSESSSSSDEEGAGYKRLLFRQSKTDFLER